jgi:hypothetical protein
VSQALSDLTFMSALKFADLNAALALPHYGVTSWDEKKLEKANGAPAVVKLTKQYFIRGYPKGTRIDSSNYNPQHAWNAGCQLVALNFQTNDEQLRLNRAKFASNGNTGYVLKPKPMRDPAAECVFRDRLVVTVKVICAMQLPKPHASKTGEVIDPYVRLVMTGAPGDATGETEHQTHVVDDNGFNPRWGEEFAFKVSSAELALLTLRVMEKDALSSEFIGDCSVPVHALRPGYRFVPLWLAENREEPLAAPTGVLCHFAIAADTGSPAPTSTPSCAFPDDLDTPPNEPRRVADDDDDDFADVVPIARAPAHGSAQKPSPQAKRAPPRRPQTTLSVDDVDTL